MSDFVLSSVNPISDPLKIVEKRAEQMRKAMWDSLCKEFPSGKPFDKFNVDFYKIFDLLVINDPEIVDVELLGRAVVACPQRKIVISISPGKSPVVQSLKEALANPHFVKDVLPMIRALDKYIFTTALMVGDGNAARDAETLAKITDGHVLEFRTVEEAIAAIKLVK